MTLQKRHQSRCCGAGGDRHSKIRWACRGASQCTCSTTCGVPEEIPTSVRSVNSGRDLPLNVVLYVDYYGTNGGECWSMLNFAL